jgi:hypothetical protein
MGHAGERGTFSPAEAGFPLRSNKSQSLLRPIGGRCGQPQVCPERDGYAKEILKSFGEKTVLMNSP